MTAFYIIIIYKKVLGFYTFLQISTYRGTLNPKKGFSNPVFRVLIRFILFLLI